MFPFPMVLIFTFFFISPYFVISSVNAQGLLTPHLLSLNSIAPVPTDPNSIIPDSSSVFPSDISHHKNETSSFKTEAPSPRTEVPNSSTLFIATYSGKGEPILTRLGISGKRSDQLLPPHLKAPLGSLWKLLVYVFLEENQRTPSPYQCHGKNWKQEYFCCKRGKSIQMDAALYQSCGLFFDLERISIARGEWYHFWRSRLQIPYPWLLRLENVKSETQVPIREILLVFYQLRKLQKTQSKLHSLLSKVFLQGTLKESLKILNQVVRVKTYTWDHPFELKKYVGGFAGWLRDGSIVWMMGEGTSSQIVKNWERDLYPFLYRQSKLEKSRECVLVPFFPHQSIQEIQQLPRGEKVFYGILKGKYRLFFEDGTVFDFESQGELTFDQVEGKKRLEGTLDIHEFIARVIGQNPLGKSAEEVSKALAIVIRSALYQTGIIQGCYFAPIIQAQQITLKPANDWGKHISYWTQGLILDTEKTPDWFQQFSQEKALQLAQQGFLYDKILYELFPLSHVAFQSSYF